MKPKVLVTRKLPGDGIERLREVADVEVHTGKEELTKEQLIQAVADKDAVISLLVNEIDAEVMDAAPHLKVISNYAVGFNNIDVNAAQERGIIVTNTPDVLTESTADLTWALLLAVARRIPESDSYTREGKFVGWAPELLLGRTVYGKTLGIIGMGRIGEAVARRAKGFGMNIVYYNRRPLSTEIETGLGAIYASLDEVISKADFLSLHTPLTRETRYLIDENELNAMKKTAYLINTSRGPLVNEKALVNALKANAIAGAGLDVFENEPTIEEELLSFQNVVLAPHIGSATIETRVEMADLAINNTISILKGENALTPVYS
ncbi:D-glycerate dehydrogenase [Alkalihalobacillus sp. BA299]|uniref:2-hydroxyacid dehydrogenase n=1 Tax=Alkalihalobacillus sp. BA299 TaxID=2815938 RepID=UPI001ADCB271|nr:D-glycerate dehydrogenase [Alkalihalobacillus sp. BA299]